MESFKVFLWTVLGTILGGLSAFALTAYMAYSAVKQSPDDPSAGSVATVIAVFLPLGISGGIALGLTFGLKRKKKRMKLESVSESPPPEELN
jgi:hypothetical protein